jgi:hypothetical protein
MLTELTVLTPRGISDCDPKPDEVMKHSQFVCDVTENALEASSRKVYQPAQQFLISYPINIIPHKWYITTSPLMSINGPPLMVHQISLPLMDGIIFSKNNLIINGTIVVN